jgi:tRNA modification GTPase
MVVGRAHPTKDHNLFGKRPTEPRANVSTVVVELTPAGRGAVAVALVAGAKAGELVGRFFQPAGRFRADDLPLNRIVFGRWRPGGEELVVCRRAADQIEVHCHGGDAAVRTIIDGLVQCGCENRSWRQWLEHSEPDPIRVAAQIMLAEAPTVRTAAILLEQLQGALAASLRAAIGAVGAADWSKAAGIVGDLLRRRELGLHLTSPWQVVVAGPPNVGKSSLINAIAGYERAIVAPLPGTTRDVVTVTTAIDGWPVELADTAGLRDSPDQLESAGIELATKAVMAADLVLLVEDASAAGGRSRMDRLYSPAILAGLSVARGIRVRNKIDLLPLRSSSATGSPRLSSSKSASAVCPEVSLQFLLQWPTLSTSALTGNGIAKLIAAVGRALVPNPPPRGAGVPFRPEHVETLLAAQSAIQQRDAEAVHVALQSLLAS